MFNKNQSSVPQKNVETIIGPSVKLEGTFKGEGDLVVEGILIGSLETKKNLKIGANAIVQANIRADNAFVSGKIKGNISVKGKLEVTNTAIILGDIKAKIISIESGALVQGKIIMPVQNITEPTKEKEEEKKEEEVKESKKNKE